MKTILTLTDFSELARAAYPTAVSIAREFGATLHLGHEVESIPPAYYGYGMTEAESKEQQNRLRAELVRETNDSAAFAGVQVEPHLFTPQDVHATVLDFLDETPTDLVVVSTHGRSGPSHLLLGSFAEKIAQRSPAPVLTWRPRDEGVEPFRPQSILVPFNFSPGCEAMFPLVKTLAQKYNARVIVLNVLPIPHEFRYAEDAERRLEERLESICAAPLDGLDVVYAACPGVPHREIVREAKGRDVDLVVLATQGYTGLSRLIFGSTAAKVQRTAPCSVLTVRPPCE